MHNCCLLFLRVLQIWRFRCTGRRVRRDVFFMYSWGGVRAHEGRVYKSLEIQMLRAIAMFWFEFSIIGDLDACAGVARTTMQGLHECAHVSFMFCVLVLVRLCRKRQNTHHIDIAICTDCTLKLFGSRRDTGIIDI